MKFLSLFLVIVLSFLVFIPKQNLYFLAEKELLKYDIIISDEIFQSELLGFGLKNAKIYVKGVNIAKIDSARLSLRGAYLKSKEIGYAYLKINFKNKSIDIYFIPTQTFIRKYKIALKYFNKEKNGKYKHEYKPF